MTILFVGYMLAFGIAAAANRDAKEEGDKLGFITFLLIGALGWITVGYSFAYILKRLDDLAGLIHTDENADPAEERPSTPQ